MARTQFISTKEAAALVKDGMTVMIGGFLCNGTAMDICDEIAKTGVKDLTVICNDCGFENAGAGRLLREGCIKTLIASHVGMNKEVAERKNNGTLELILQPQGTLAEQIRAGGAGLGGVLTPTGMGTIVAEGKDTVTVDGKEYLLEKPLKADVAICAGYVADESGNIRYKGSTRNFNMMMAAAADTTVFEVEKVVPAGEIGPNFVETPHVYVDYVVKKED